MTEACKGQAKSVPLYTVMGALREANSSPDVR